MSKFAFEGNTYQNKTTLTNLKQKTFQNIYFHLSLSYLILMISFVDVAWLTVCGILVFIMQAGFLCLEAGSTRSKNRINIAIKNFSDLGLSVLFFWVLGYGLMFGQSWHGIVGTTRLLPDLGNNPDIWTGSFFLFQAMFCSTAVTILSGATAERIKFTGYLAIAVLVSGLIYPLFGHWVWQGIDSATTGGWLAQRGFVDFAGSTVVHSLGGWCSLAAVLIIGPRLGRFSRKRQFESLASSDLPLACTGTMLLWFGWFGFNGGSNLRFDASVSSIIANTLMAGAVGLVVPVAMASFQNRKVDVATTMNGSLAALVAVTAGCHALSSVNALLVGAVGSLLMMKATHLLEAWKVDDVVGAIPVHLVAGIWGTLAVGLFGELDRLGTGLSRLAQIKAQTEGVIACGLWAFVLTLICLLVLDRFKLLRVSPRDEYIGLNISEHGAKSDADDVYSVMRHHAKTGDLRRRVKVDSFTEVGRVGQWYNQVIMALENAIATNRAIVTTAIDGIITVQCQSLIIESANPAMKKLFGYEPSHLVGQLLAQILSDPLSTEQLIHISQAGLPHRLAARHSSRISFPVEITATADDTRFTIFLRDISARQRAEDTLAIARKQEQEKAIALEHAMTQLKKTQAELVQRERIAGQGQLVAGIAHEINNPVGFIYGNLEHTQDYVNDLLQAIELYRQSSAGLPEDVRSYLNAQLNKLDIDYITADFPTLIASMQTGAERIQNIVLQLRTFSHYDEAEVKSVNIHDGLDSALMLLTPRLSTSQTETANQQTDVEIVRLYGELPPVECYASALNRVFLNILTNALDAFARGNTSDPKITLKTHLVASRVIVTISNNGPCIPPAEQSQIFDPFFTTQPVGTGTGLGCTISYQIVVEQHYGQLTCHSAAGKGTCFVIELPVSVRDAKAQKDASQKANAQTSISTQRRPIPLPQAPSPA